MAALVMPKPRAVKVPCQNLIHPHFLGTFSRHWVA
jgi:hypothetical protein